MKMLRAVTVVAMASVALPGSLVLPSSAAATTGGGDNAAVCKLVFTERFHPGFTLVPSSGHQDSAVDSGTIACVGRIQGQWVDGPGTIWNQGKYTDSTCLLDHAEGRYFFTVPTEEGLLSVNGSFAVSRVGAVLTVHLEQPGARGEGSAVVVPTQGDCVIAPVTEALVLMSVAFQDVDPTDTPRVCALDLEVVRIGCRT